MNGERSVVRLHDCVRHLGGGHDAECALSSVRILLPDLRDEQSPHPRPSSSALLESRGSATGLREVSWPRCTGAATWPPRWPSPWLRPCLAKNLRPELWKQSNKMLDYRPTLSVAWSRNYLAMRCSMHQA